VSLLLIINFWPSNASSFIEPATLQQLVAFQSMGKMIHTQEYTHLWFQIDLTGPSALDEQTTSYYRDNSGANWHLTIDLQKQHLEVLLWQLKDLWNMDNPEALREVHNLTVCIKWSLAPLQLGVGVFMGVYNTYQMGQLHEQILALQRSQEAIIHQVDKHGQCLNEHAWHIGILDELVQEARNSTHHLSLDLMHNALTTMLVQLVQAHVADITMTIEVAMAQRASTLLAPLDMVARALNDLDIVATQRGYELLVTKPADIF
jgi:hypothetical protein